MPSGTLEGKHDIDNYFFKYKHFQIIFLNLSWVLYNLTDAVSNCERVATSLNMTVSDGPSPSLSSIDKPGDR